MPHTFSRIKPKPKEKWYCSNSFRSNAQWMKWQRSGRGLAMNKALSWTNSRGSHSNLTSPKPCCRGAYQSQAFPGLSHSQGTLVWLRQYLSWIMGNKDVVVGQGCIRFWRNFWDPSLAERTVVVEKGNMFLILGIHSLGRLLADH